MKIDWDGFQESFFDFLGHATIISKDEGRVLLDMYDAQRYFFDEIFDGLRHDIHWFVAGKGRQVGICLAPETLVLTADLRWVRIHDILVGTPIICVDEHPPAERIPRRMKTGTVVGKVDVCRKAYRIRFDDGRSVICTAQHPWLSRKSDVDWQWRSIEGHRVGCPGPSAGLKIGSQIRWITKPWGPAEFEDGWFGGMLDGEGSLAKENHLGARVTVSQTEGPVWDRLNAYVSSRGYHAYVKPDTRPERDSKYGTGSVPQIQFSRLDELFRLIGQTRPTRFLGKHFWQNKAMPRDRSGDGVGYATIVSIEEYGEQRMVDLQTSHGTYIAEGFVSHNTTGMYLFDVFYAGAVPDIQAGVVFDGAENKEKFRKLFAETIDSLPASHRLPIVSHNRAGVTFKNGNMLDYLIAGQKKGQGTLGRSRALNFAHMDEVAYYGDPDAFEAFKDVLSDRFPQRCYVAVSTGNGWNHFADLWEDALSDTLSKRTIFVTWWRKRTYSYERGTALFRKYGWSQLSEDEREATEIVKRDYGHRITLEQWAWYRHRADPRAQAESGRTEDDSRQDVITQEHPHFPDQMFRGTGSPFIPSQYLAPAEARASKAVFKAYSYYLGADVTATKIELTRFFNKAHLKVWAEPHPNGVYVVAGDPAFGISDDGDGFCVQVVRCYADRLVQVAEFCDRSIQPYQFAWVLVHLCGWYGNCRYILELNGPGEAVWTEMRNLRTRMEEDGLYPRRPNGETDLTDPPETSWRNMLAKVRQYLYHRQDSLGGGGYNYHMKTSLESKFTFMTQFADRFMLDQFQVNSVQALKEMRTLRKDGRSIQAEVKKKDDRPVALGLATRCYLDSEWRTLVSRNATFEAESEKDKLGGEDGDMSVRFMSSMMSNHLAAKAKMNRDAVRRARRGQRWNW